MDHTMFYTAFMTAFLAAILSYFEKYLIKDKTLDYLLIRNFCILIVLMITCLVMNQKINVKQFTDTNYLMKVFFISIITLYYLYNMYYGIYHYSLSNFFVTFTILYIIIICLIGLLLENENFTTKKIIGIIISCIGMYYILVE